MLTNPTDKFNRIIKIVESELRTQYINHCSLDSTPILEMVRDELVELELELTDDYSVTALWRRFKHWYSMRQSNELVRTTKHSGTRTALSLVTQALREEENRYDSRSFSYWLSPLWQKLNVTRGLLTKELKIHETQPQVKSSSDTTGDRKTA